MRIKSFTIVFAVLALSAQLLAEQITLNGLTIKIDDRTGGITELRSEGVGTVLTADAPSAGIIDLAYPIEKFEPLRLAPRFSCAVKINKTKDSVTLQWDQLGKSREFEVAGKVSAEVTFRAAADGRSIILSAKVSNQSKNAVRQVIFPDFPGMRAFAGADQTMFRAGGMVSAPFVELAPTEERASTQYMVNDACYAADYKAGGLFHPMVMRWMDFGSLRGGISLFPKRWGWQPQVVTRLQLSEFEQSLRWMCLHEAEIKSDATWESGEFWLTPHAGGWAKGIEPYRAWVKQNYSREHPLPKHVREGLGYRTAWMCQNQPDDPKDAVFAMKDLPKLADDAKAHGIDEMVLWSWNRGFVLPLPPPYPHLGTEQDFIDAVAECRKRGVNVAPFISVLQANTQTAPRYGLKVVDNNGWTFHTELIPRWNPPYAQGFACIPVSTGNELWQNDVLAGVTHLIDSGIPSLGWDQFWSTEQKPNMNTLATKIRARAKAKDPESTLCGEELWNIEVDSAQLDYTWNWGSYRDVRPVTSLFPAPRINVCITGSALAVKKAFADNLYINVSPRKAGSINGSDYIANVPAMSEALKQCAALRKQFLRYFVEGTLIGDCILAKPAPAAHLCAYLLPKSVLIIAVKQPSDGPIALEADLASWCESKSGEYKVMAFDGQGAKVAEFAGAPAWKAETVPLKAGDIVIYEIAAK